MKRIAQFGAFCSILGFHKDGEREGCGLAVTPTPTSNRYQRLVPRRPFYTPPFPPGQVTVPNLCCHLPSAPLHAALPVLCAVIIPYMFSCTPPLTHNPSPCIPMGADTRRTGPALSCSPAGIGVRGVGWVGAGLLHISQLSASRVEDVKDVVDVGDKLFVKVTNIGVSPQAGME